MPETVQSILEPGLHNKHHGSDSGPEIAKSKPQPDSHINSPVSEPGSDSEYRSATVIFVLGGPGSGKGTQCAKLVADYGFKHLSAGDLLRAEEKNEESKSGELIKKYITEGKIVPTEITLALLKKAIGCTMKDTKNTRFLIDGFPREMQQALAFEKSVCQSKFTLFLDCPQSVMKERIIKRSSTSHRDDDNIESAVKRFKTFIDVSMPVVDYFSQKDKVVNVDATRSIDEVYETVKERFAERGVKIST